MARAATPPAASTLPHRPRRGAALLGPLLLFAAGGALHSTSLVLRSQPPLRVRVGPVPALVIAAAGGAATSRPGCFPMVAHHGQPLNGAGTARRAVPSATNTPEAANGSTVAENTNTSNPHDAALESTGAEVVLAGSSLDVARNFRVLDGHDNNVDVSQWWFEDSLLNEAEDRTFRKRRALAGNPQEFRRQTVRLENVSLTLGDLKSKADGTYMALLQELRFLWRLANCPNTSQKAKNKNYDITRTEIGEIRTNLEKARSIALEVPDMFQDMINTPPTEDSPSQPQKSVEELDEELLRARKQVESFKREKEWWLFSFTAEHEKNRTEERLAFWQKCCKELRFQLDVALGHEKNAYAGQMDIAKARHRLRSFGVGAPSTLAKPVATAWASGPASQ